MKPGFVRVIAGKWRGRRLKVPDMEGLRPTPDRVRETLFNWLSTIIVDKYCLDLFAGTGALGFEALSRGAAYVVMVDQSTPVVKMLQEQLAAFGADNALVYNAVVPKQLRAFPHPFEVVFLDPPYQAGILFSCCEYLEASGMLAEEAYIYLEAPQIITDDQLPANWQIIKSQQAGQVAYHLARRGKKHD